MNKTSNKTILKISEFLDNLTIFSVLLLYEIPFLLLFIITTFLNIVSLKKMLFIILLWNFGMWFVSYFDNFLEFILLKINKNSNFKAKSNENYIYGIFIGDIIFLLIGIILSLKTIF